MVNERFLPAGLRAALLLALAGITASGASAMSVTDLPVGSAPAPVALSHFPDRLHAFIWRNWQLVPPERMAQVVGARPADVLRIGKAMGLAGPPKITPDQQRRSYISVIKRNWHLLPYEQLLALLGWTPEQLAYTLREDDFLFIKLGNLKPRCEPLRYQPPDAQALAREKEIAAVVHETFPEGVGPMKEPLFGFVSALSQAPAGPSAAKPAASRLSPRYCYSYFALYGDPLLEKDADPFPDGYLARLAACGADGVWLQAVLYKLAPFPWDPALSDRHEERVRNLRALARRVRQHGMGLYLYFNEPRAMPAAFYQAHPELKGTPEGDHAALCTSVPEVQRYLADSVAALCRAVPELAGIFTITASENLTNCWSHGGGARCPRCSKRSPAEVIAEVNGLIAEGIRRAGTGARLIAWDWGWSDAWAPDAVRRLPDDVSLMSVSEWSLPITRGGVSSSVGEYSISSIGPGPRATAHWQVARQRGLKTIAKIQAGNTWELSAVPYIPAVENVAQHALNLQGAGVDGLMLGWTLGGYPSPNLEVVAEIGAEAAAGKASVDEAMAAVAGRRFGAGLAPAVVAAWKECSRAFREFPYNGSTVYSAPLQTGPANLLWGEPTGYHASMVGFPYDDLDAWRSIYPPEVFAGQLEKVADGFDRALAGLQQASAAAKLTAGQRQAIAGELSVMEAAAIHFRSAANQSRFVIARRALAAAKTPEERAAPRAALEKVLKEEMSLARRLYALQVKDSRLGFEASNHYYYVPVDLAEKVLNCRYLLEHWLPAGGR